MKKQNPMNLFMRIISLVIIAFLLFFVVSAWRFSFFIVALLSFVVIIVFVMNIVHKLAANTIENKFQRLKECGNCKAIIPEESEFCPNCGTDLKETIVVCDYCGHINKKGSVVCEKCNGLIG